VGHTLASPVAYIGPSSGLSSKLANGCQWLGIKMASFYPSLTKKLDPQVIMMINKK